LNGAAWLGCYTPTEIRGAPKSRKKEEKKIVWCGVEGGGVEKKPMSVAIHLAISESVKKEKKSYGDHPEGGGWKTLRLPI